MKRKLLSILALLCFTVSCAWAQGVNYTTNDIGKLMGSDGKVYATAADVPWGVTVSGMIAYVNTTEKCGLVIGPSDLYPGGYEGPGLLSNSDAVISCNGYDRALPAAALTSWRLPSQDDFNKMIGDDGCQSADNLRQLKGRQANTCADGTSIWGMQTSDGYWSSTETETAGVYYNLWADNCGSVATGASTKYVRPCFTFNIEGGNSVISYIQRSATGEGTNTKVTETTQTCTDYKILTGSPTNATLGAGWYVLRGDVNIPGRLTFTGNANLILCDGYTLNAGEGIDIDGGYTLTIYGQTKDTGTIIATAKNRTYSNGIGGNEASSRLIIHGGNIRAFGCPDGLSDINDRYNGIGVFELTILGGIIYAEGGKEGGGLGIGYPVGSTGFTKIYGGKITAVGHDKGPGICSDIRGNGPLYIYGGEIWATGGENGAGIGGGRYGSDAVGLEGNQTRNIWIYGGKVTATGGKDAAGIGAGAYRWGGRVEIRGGIVIANGNGAGAGIGGGKNGKAGSAYIHGGTVIAKAGEESGTGYRAIGPGEGSDEYGDVYIGDAMTVWAGTTASYYPFGTGERVGACQNNPYAEISVCNHSGSTITIDDGFTHHHNGCIYCAVAADAKQNHSFNDASKCICGLVSLNDNADNAAIINTYKGTSQAITLAGRKLYKDDSWNTLCLPFNLNNFMDTPLADAIVKTLESASFDETSGQLTLNFSTTNLTAIEAGKPYIVKWTSGNDIENPVFTGVTVSNTTADVETTPVTFKGLYAPLNIGSKGDNTKLYLAADNKVYYPNGAMTIGCQRAYFQLNGIMAGDPSAGVRAFVLNFEGTSTTGVKEVKEVKEVKDNSWYTLDGRRLNSKPTQKGIYINNGKKQVIK